MDYQDSGVTEYAADTQQDTPQGDNYESQGQPDPYQGHEQQAQPEQPQGVPLAALEDERRKRQQAEKEAELYRNHFAMMQSQQGQQQQPSGHAQEPEFSDDDIPTYGQIKQMYSQIERKHNDKLAELETMQRHADYAEVVTTYLPQAIQENPLLRQELEASPNRYELAYYLAKKSDAYLKKNQQVQHNQEAERIIQNAQQSPGLAPVGRSSGGAPAQDYANMSDEQFASIASGHLGRSIYF